MSWRRTAIFCVVTVLGGLLVGCRAESPTGSSPTGQDRSIPSAGVGGTGPAGTASGDRAGTAAVPPAGTAQPAGGTAAGTTCPTSADYPAGAGHEAGEVPGGGPGTTLWALLFLTGGKLTAGAETKIVWRMTGTGDPTMRATGPGGAEITPVWGPTGHTGSTWNRPGGEWGTGWLFPTAGCWTMQASRSDGATASLVLRVAPA